ncbi:MAG TPA: ComEC/Rec2 family competence protein [Candidatus Omnitrophota bacterium]|nr:ComEC/Rec2 family competence protein [Candidatus Omnitrophota bacterium]
MRPIDPFRLPASALAWMLLAAGHAAGWAAPVPAALAVPALAASLGLGAASLLAGAVGSRRAGGARRAPFLRAEATLGAAALVAAGAVLAAEVDAASPPLPVHPRAARVRVVGRVLDTTTLEANPASVLFEARRVGVGGHEAACDARVVLRFGDEAGVPRWAFPGLWLEVSGDFRPPEDARNPGVEAPGRWLERSGVAGTIDADPLGVSAASDPSDPGAGETWVWRDRIARAFDRALTSPVAGLARGMILGDRSLIAPATRNDFRDGGTIHILSISGLHVCILGGFVALAAAGLRLALTPALALELLAVWGYTFLVGAPASAARAALLWTAVRGGRAAGREVRPIAAWGSAGLLLHLFDPRSVHDPGFQLSFAAVLGLLAAGGLGGESDEPDAAPVRVVKKWVRGGAAIALQSAGATAGTAGLSARLFGALPVAGFVLNLAVVPLCGVFMGEAFFYLAADATRIPFLRNAAAGALDASGLILLAVNAWGARAIHPWPLRRVPTVAALAASSALLILGAALREGSRHESPRVARTLRRVALLAALAAGILPLAASFLPTGARRPAAAALVAIDVGQGDALFARGAEGTTLLVDGGPATESRDMGKAAVEPLLRAEGIARLDRALLSHAHGDHFGGLEWLARRGWIPSLLENGSDPRAAWRRAIDADLRARGGRRVVVARDTTLVAEGTRTSLCVWAPPADSLVRARGNAIENNRSLVATLTLDGARTFLPGDAEDEAEAADLPRVTPVEVLKAPHHGSRTSSTAEWVRALAPRIVLVSCGEKNRFGHPSRATMGRYRLAGARVFRTDQEGAIRVTIARGGAWVSTRAHPEPEWVSWQRPKSERAASRARQASPVLEGRQKVHIH